MTSTWTSRKNSLHLLLICATTMISVKDSSSQTANLTSIVTTVESKTKPVSTLHSNLLPLTTKGLTPSPTTAVTEAKTTREGADHAETTVKDATTSKGVYLVKANTTVTTAESLGADHAETTVKDTATDKGVYLAKAKTTVTSTESLGADHAETTVNDTTTSKGVYLAKAKTTVTSTESLAALAPQTRPTADTKFKFDYDYKTLRRNGLIVAAIFFLVGILIIPCARVKRSRPKFSTGRKRSYNLTQP